MRPCLTMRTCTVFNELFGVKFGHQDHWRHLTDSLGLLHWIILLLQVHNNISSILYNFTVHYAKEKKGTICANQLWPIVIIKYTVSWGLRDLMLCQRCIISILLPTSPLFTWTQIMQNVNVYDRRLEFYLLHLSYALIWYNISFVLGTSCVLLESMKRYELPPSS